MEEKKKEDSIEVEAKPEKKGLRGRIFGDPVVILDDGNNL